MNEFGVILFHTTSSAIRAEKVALKAAFDCKLIPTPRELSSDCGVALKFKWSDADGIKSYLKKAGVEYSFVHQL